MPRSWLPVPSPASSSNSAARRRSVWPRPSGTRACRSSGPALRPSTSPRTAEPSVRLAEADLPAPKHGTAYSVDEALEVARGIGYPVLVRPSHVLGGRGMEIVYDDDTLVTYVERATTASPEHPVLVDRFLDDAVEIDVDVPL